MAAAQAEDVRASFLIMCDLVDHHQKFFQRRANEVYAEAGRQFSLRRWDVLKYAKCLHKWWSTLKSAVFRFGKAEMLSAHFNGKPSRDPIDLPSTSHPSSSLTSFAFRSREVRLLMLDQDSNGGTDPLRMFPLFLKRTADVLASHLAVVSRRPLRFG